MRLANCLNEATAGVEESEGNGLRMATLDMLELESSIQELIPVIPFKRDSK